ncbi:MAG: hypothetical protein IMY72_01420 [Bacteroidetes bacterium]|nr:hypothetical protein [Bacteroidota bacterium]
MRYILVLIDFLGDSVHALENAIEYTNKLNANIRMIHFAKKNTAFHEIIDFHDYFRVVFNSACCVVTNRLYFEKIGLEKNVMQLDPSKETRQKVPFITDITQAFSANIHLVDISSSNKNLNNYSNQVANYINKKNVKCYRNFFIGNSVY